MLVIQAADVLRLGFDASDGLVASDRVPLLGATRSFPLKSARVDDLDVDAVPFPNCRELGRDAGQAHAKLFCNLFGIDLEIRQNLLHNLTNGHQSNLFTWIGPTEL